MPEQEFPPPRRLVRPYRPDPDDEEPPPWADLPPVRPVRSGHPGGPGHPAGPGRPGGPAGPGGRPGGHRRLEVPEDELEAQWAQWQQPEAEEAEEAAPPPPAREPRGPGGRALRAAARRRRRWYYMGGGVVVVVGAVLAVVLLAGGRPGPAAVTPGELITTFQPGELRQVPNACHVVPAATVAQYLPGTPKVASPQPVNGSAGSACNWTVDKPPLYRLMQVNLNAYAPDGLASGNGSATRAATDAYDLALQDLQTPPRHSPSSRATVQVLSGFGNQAFSALQVFHVGGAVTDVATVMVRYHNVIVTVKLNGLERSNKGNYGPVSKTQLAAAAMAFARAAEASLH